MKIPEAKVFLKEVNLFTNMSGDIRAIIGRLCHERKCKPNEVIIKEGEHEESNDLYIVVEGALQVLMKVKTRQGDEVEKAFQVYSKRDYFGDIELFAGEAQPASATITALEKSVLLVLDGKKLITLLMKYPHLMIEVCGQFSRRVRELNKAHLTGDI